MKKSIVLYLFVLCHLSHAYNFKNNIGVMWQRNQDVLRIFGLSKALYGFTFIGFSSNSNITDAYYFKSHVKDYTLITQQFTGKTRFSNLTLHNTSENFVLKIIDWNSYPIPTSDRLLWNVYDFNVTNLQKHFNIEDRIWIYFGMKEYFLPSSALEEDMKQLSFSEEQILEIDFKKCKELKIKLTMKHP
jgi:hypothetical protein